MMVVIVVIGIVTSLALVRSGNASEQFKRENASVQLKTAFERARSDSVKRRADALGPPVVPLAYVRIDSATQFTLVTDANQDGDLLDAVDSVTTTFPARINLAPRTGLTLPLTVAFNKRGEPTVTDPSFVVCNGVCTFANDTSAIAAVVHVTASGTVNLLAGGSTIPSFATPNVTAIGTSTSIRSQTYISPTPAP
jgi:Tfp pilus assembly protein FimT